MVKMTVCSSRPSLKGSQERADNWLVILGKYKSREYRAKVEELHR